MITIIKINALNNAINKYKESEEDFSVLLDWATQSRDHLIEVQIKTDKILCSGSSSNYGCDEKYNNNCYHNCYNHNHSYYNNIYDDIDSYSTTNEDGWLYYNRRPFTLDTPNKYRSEWYEYNEEYWQ